MIIASFDYINLYLIHVIKKIKSMVKIIV